MRASAANLIVRTLLAPVCAACRTRLERPLDSPICRRCWLAIPRLSPPLCDWCGDVLVSTSGLVPLCARCLDAPPGFDVARSAGRYDGALRDLIHAFKYERRRILAEPLARLLRHAGTPVLAGADAVVPVPLHPWRAWQRGFNQADDLAQHLGLPVWRVLRRTRRGPPQASLSAERRERAARGAFVAGRPWLAIVPVPASTRRLLGSTIVVVDDVMTTGATLDACSRALIEAGAKQVRALTVARTVAARPAPPRLRPPPSTGSRR
jgi:ComF family protein